MKKILSGVLVTALALGIGTTAYVTYAHGVSTNDVISQKVNNVQQQNYNTTKSNQYQDFMEQQGVNVDDMEQYMEQQGVNVDEMYQWMNTNPDMNQMYEYMNQQGIDFNQMGQFMDEQNINFGQAQKFMQEVNPNLSNEDIQDAYRSMHGTQWSSNSRNFSSMMN